MDSLLKIHWKKFPKNVLENFVWVVGIHVPVEFSTRLPPGTLLKMSLWIPLGIEYCHFFRNFYCKRILVRFLWMILARTPPKIASAIPLDGIHVHMFLWIFLQRSFQEFPQAILRFASKVSQENSRKIILETSPRVFFKKLHLRFLMNLLGNALKNFNRSWWSILSTLLKELIEEYDQNSLHIFFFGISTKLYLDFFLQKILKRFL